MDIGGREIGFGCDTYIIAEAGINHNGEYDLAKKFVDIAVNAGADAVKFQTFKYAELAFRNLTYEQYEKIKLYCDFKGITFLSTPHSISAIDFLDSIVPAFKIASPHINHKYFLKKIMRKNKPLIISTGSLTNKNKRASDQEIYQLFQYINNYKDVALLYCISKYPCYNFDVDEFTSFRERYSRYPVGISCHSPEIEFSLTAVEAGAYIVEKHITFDKDFDCPDKESSITPEVLTEMIEKIREYERDVV